MRGTRFYPADPGNIPIGHFRAGDFYQDNHGDWHGVTPNGLHVWFKNHRVTEHEDGTITVSPSILANTGEGGVMWHGYLEKGFWREC